MKSLSWKAFFQHSKRIFAHLVKIANFCLKIIWSLIYKHFMAKNLEEMVLFAGLSIRNFNHCWSSAISSSLKILIYLLYLTYYDIFCNYFFNCHTFHRYINCSRSEAEQNLIAIQYHGFIFYRAFKHIQPNTELLVWYGKGYARELGLSLEPDPNMPVVDPSKLSFCCLMVW